MSNFFICPFCEGHLKVGDYIIFSTRTSGKKKGLLLLHSEVGNYSSLKHPSYAFKKGDSLEFYCPLCQASLASDIDKNLVHVLMIDEQHEQHEIYFSRIAGEYSTYKVSEDEVWSTGEHSSRYTYFKFPYEHRKYTRRKPRS